MTAADKSSQAATPPLREAHRGGDAVARPGREAPFEQNARGAPLEKEARDARGASEGRGGEEEKDTVIVDDDGLRRRRDIVSGQILPESRLLRFVADPDGHVVPDAAAKLPGRGLWVEASRTAIAKAVEKKLFSRAAKAQVHATADLAARAEQALVNRMAGDLGIARRSGALVLGFDNVERALSSVRPPRALVEAADGAADGRRKLFGLARRLNCVTIAALTSAELGLALGRENVIHAAIQPGGLADRLILDAGRLQGFRPVTPVRTESPRANASKIESKP